MSLPRDLRRTIALLVVLGLAALLFLGLGAEVGDDDAGTARFRDPNEPRPEPVLQGAPGATAPTGTDDEAAGDRPTGPATVEVFVRDDEYRPLEGARVKLWQTRPAAELGEGLTNTEGRVVFRNVPVTHVRARAFVAEHRSEKGEADATLEPVTLELELKAWPLVHGSVVAARTGKPLSGARVVLTKGGCYAGRTILVIAPEVARTFADANGRFELRVPLARALTLTGSYPGCAEASAYVCRQGKGAHVTLRLPPGGTLTGTVRSAGGAACPGAHVFVVPADDTQLVENPRRVLSEDGVAVWGDDGVECSTLAEGEGEIRRTRRTKTDAEGRYEIGGLSLPRAYRVLAESPDGARGVAEPVGLSDEGPAARRDVRLQPVHVLVVNVEGKGSLFLEGPVEGFLELRAPGSIRWSLDGDSVRIPALPRGTYEITVRIEGSCLLKRTIEIGESPEQEVTLQADEGVTLEGIVVEPDGRPAQGVKVAWLAGDDCGVFGTDDATSDERGRFRISYLRPVPGELRVESDYWFPDSLGRVTPGAKTVRVVVRRPPVLEARFLVPAGSVEARDPWVVVQTDERTLNCAAFGRDDRGVIRIPLPVEERVHVMFRPHGGAYVLRGPYTARAGEVVYAGDVPFTEGRAVRGRVTDKGGKALEGARVTTAFPRLPAHMSLMNPPTATTTSDGTFELTGVHEGPAVLRIHHAVFVARPLEVLDPADEVHITALRGARVWGTLHDKRRPVRFIPLDEGASETDVHFPDEYGRLRIGPLLPGRYRVTTANTGPRPPDGIEPEEEQELEIIELIEGKMKRVHWTID